MTAKKAARKKKAARRKAPRKKASAKKKRARRPITRDQRAAPKKPESLKAGRVPLEDGPGKPRVEIDPVEIYKLAVLGIPQRDIADLMSISRKTMEARFADTPEVREAWVRGHAEMKKGIRSAMMTSCLVDRSPTTIKFLAMTTLKMIPGIGDDEADDGSTDLAHVLAISLAKFLAKAENRGEAPEDREPEGGPAEE